jgi:hypothetical protein
MNDQNQTTIRISQYDEITQHFTKVLEDIKNINVYCSRCEYKNNTKQKEVIYKFVIVHTFSYCSEYCSFNHGHEFRKRYYKNIR